MWKLETLLKNKYFCQVINFPFSSSPLRHLEYNNPSCLISKSKVLSFLVVFHNWNNVFLMDPLFPFITINLTALVRTSIPLLHIFYQIKYNFFLKICKNIQELQILINFHKNFLLPCLYYLDSPLNSNSNKSSNWEM